VLTQIEVDCGCGVRPLAAHVLKLIARGATSVRAGRACLYGLPRRRDRSGARA